MSVSRAAKVRRLAANSRVPHSVLSDIVSQLRAAPELLETELSRFAVRRAVEELWSAMGYTERVATTSGAFEWDCLSLPKTLQYLATNCESFRSALREAWAAHPSTEDRPWRLVVYGDEVVPGNVLRLDNRRKFFGVYVTIAELGPSLVKHECMWIALAMIRSAVAKDIHGGLSGCAKTLFRRWFLADKVGSEGVLLDLGIPGSRYARVFFRLGNIVADGDAFRALWSAKGASGKLPCLMCKNVLSERVSSSYLVHFSCPHVELFDLASNEDIWEKADMLTASRSRARRAEHEQLQMRLGLTDNPEGLLWALDLRAFVRPASAVTFDSMHCLVSNGIAQNETALLLDCLRSKGVVWRHLREFVASNWKVCSALGSPKTLQDCFSGARETAFRKEAAFKSGASEMLLVAPVIQYFLHRVVGAPTIPDQADSFDKLCHVLRLVSHIKLGGHAADELAEALKSHALAFAKAYPEAACKPKNHYVQHVPGQVRRDGMLLDCFVGERKHGSLKRHADCVKNTSRFEHSVLLRALSAQVSKLEEPGALRDGVAEPADCPALAASVACRTAAIGRALKWGGTRIAMGDCVFVDGAMHIVIAGASLDEELHLLTKPYTRVSQVGRVLTLKS